VDIKPHLEKLKKYIEENDYKGWDLFDGLNSRVFKNSPFYKSRILRLAWIQFFKRSPINFRKIAFVPKDYNAKGLGLFASGLISSGNIEAARSLLDQLKRMTCLGFEGTNWGYNFDWQARAFYVPVGTPNMVTTAFVANAFLDYLSADFTDCTDSEIKEYHALAVSACEFILNELILFEDDETLCFGYIPGKQARVHNANMLGAALLARVYSYNKDVVFYKKSQKAMAYSVSALNEDFSWPYGELHHHKFIDNFHTGYNLVALKDWMDYTEDDAWQEKLKSAYGYFLDTFWLENGCPKYYDNSLYPIDIHCSAQGIVTCLKLKNYDDRSVSMAYKIAKWAIDNMQNQEGYFYYQKTKWYTNKIPYMRWSQAWIFYALCHLLKRSAN